MKCYICRSNSADIEDKRLNGPVCSQCVLETARKVIEEPDYLNTRWGSALASESEYESKYGPEIMTMLNSRMRKHMILMAVHLDERGEKRLAIQLAAHVLLKSKKKIDDITNAAFVLFTPIKSRTRELSPYELYWRKLITHD